MSIVPVSACLPCFVAWLTRRSVATNVAWVSKINRDKAAGKHSAWEGKGDDRDPAFKMVL